MPEAPMPLPAAALGALALRAGAVALTAWAAHRAVAASRRPGRTDQRAEDALDATDDGLALHRPADRAQPNATQSNAAARLRRSITINGRTWHIDAALLGRLRIERT
jgi:CHASE1-domain containing sensor protein